ncbi:MAG: dienelactone hydrolase family protein [SAR202 cluster bacterium]|nr:dienelactone hydrolase family protein [SAR202 cluster bacterium]|tara:strand:- start:2170 stop:2922 length:753 start_codon:yes stop_codon:yes gene_type:complete
MPSFWEKVQVNGAQMDVYASVPEGSGPFPSVLVAQHASGVDKFIQDVADKLASSGYAAVAPDLFHRITDEMVEQTGKSKRDQLSDPEILDDINATVDFMTGHSAIDSDRIGVTGFCMGGRVTWLAAATNPIFKAAVPYYGGNIMVPWGSATQAPLALTSGIKCPVLFHFGEIDENPSQDDMLVLDAELSKFAIPHQFYTYPGANHAFMNPASPPRYQRAAAEMSWPRTLDHFDRYLKEGASPGADEPACV